MTSVTLNVYNCGDNRVMKHANKVFRLMGSGVYHAAVEVDGLEWSYGFTEEGTGVFTCAPRSCEAHIFSESLPMGTTALSAEEFSSALDRLVQTWRGPDYDLLRHNCCHFSNAMLQLLGLPPAPAWVTRTASTASMVVTPLEETISEGKQSRGAGDEAYRFGDLTRGILASGKQSRGADGADGYRFGDFSRGVLSKISG
ncbi:unnamed protein product [Effrenium voratum]|nr:unnamed protein product [Effrenium voratum]